MGSFAGHLVPGTFFIGFAVWWTLTVFIRYFRAMASHSAQTRIFRSSATFPCPCCQRLPVEGMIKLASSLLGMVGETVTGFKHGRFVHIGNAQHITMFAFFAINGLVDVLMFYRVPLPPDSDYVSMILALVVEALLFHFHLHGRTHFDIHVHTLLLYTIAASAVVCCLEMKYRNNVWCVLFRTFCTLLQGTWFYQIGFFLYNPIPGATPWDQENHDQIMLATAIFSWHMMAGLSFMASVAFVVWLCFRSREPQNYFGNIQYKNLETEDLTASVQFKGQLNTEEDEM